MKKMIDNYIVQCESKKVDLDDLLNHIRFFQHERLIHLLVTILVALVTLTLLITTFFIDNIFLVVLLVIFILLLLPYLVHYYFLENRVQELYRIYDKQKDKVK